MNSVIPCQRGARCNWPACAANCNGRPGRTPRPWDEGRDGRYTVALILDSGAFSAWTRGRTIDLNSYIDFIRANEQYLWSYVNLDMIPGRFEHPRTQKDIIRSAQTSYANLQAMKRAGLHPIPVFHQGEDFEWLTRLVADGEDYIGISPSDDTPRSAQISWIDDCFTILTDREGRPCVRTHGFGITAVASLARHPWYTVDSTTWAHTAGFGHILVPKPTPQGYDYTATMQIAICGVQRETKSLMRYERLSNAARDAVTQYLESIGTSPSECRYDVFARRNTVITYLRGLSAQLGHLRFKHRSNNLLLPQIKLPPAIDDLVFTPVMATVIDKTRAWSLKQAKVLHQLISYYYLKDLPADSLYTYVMTGGVPDDYQRRLPKTDWYRPEYLSYRARELIRRIESYDDEANRLVDET